MKKKKSTEFVDLVKSDSRIDVEDLRLILGSKLQIYTSIWIFGMGFILTTVLALNALPNDFLGSIAKVGIAVSVGVLYIVLVRRGDPEDRLKRMLADSDYLEAKGMLESGDKPQGGDVSSYEMKASRAVIPEEPENPPTSKRDIETEKLRFAWDYKKSRELTLLVIVFSAFASILTILNTLLVTHTLNPISEAGVVFGVFVVIIYYLTRVGVGLRTTIVRTDKLLIELGQGKQIESLKELCGVESEPESVWEEVSKVFPWGKTGIILFLIVAVFLIVSGFVILGL